jgi:hypothetical protein
MGSDQFAEILDTKDEVVGFKEADLVTFETRLPFLYIGATDDQL